MFRLIRHFTNGFAYFVTAVTYNRKPILTKSAPLLFETIKIFKNKYNAIVDYYVMLPEHFHLIINPNDGDISDFIHDLKLSFGARYRKENNTKSGKLWQNRFWDHMIRNQDDMNCHIDYIHYNPVKHGLVKRPFDWEYSSIHKYRDIYPDDWGIVGNINFGGEYGE